MIFGNSYHEQTSNLGGSILHVNVAYSSYLASILSSSQNDAIALFKRPDLILVLLPGAGGSIQDICIDSAVSVSIFADIIAWSQVASLVDGSSSSLLVLYVSFLSGFLEAKLAPVLVFFVGDKMGGIFGIAGVGLLFGISGPFQ